MKVEKSVSYCFGGVSEGVLMTTFHKKMLVTNEEHVLRSKYCRERNQGGLVTLQQTWFVLKLRETCQNHENVSGGDYAVAFGPYQGGVVKYCP